MVFTGDSNALPQIVQHCEEPLSLVVIYLFDQDTAELSFHAFTRPMSVAKLPLGLGMIPVD